MTSSIFVMTAVNQIINYINRSSSRRLFVNVSSYRCICTQNNRTKQLCDDGLQLVFNFSPWPLFYNVEQICTYVSACLARLINGNVIGQQWANRNTGVDPSKLNEIKNKTKEEKEKNFKHIAQTLCALGFD